MMPRRARTSCWASVVLPTPSGPTIDGSFAFGPEDLLAGAPGGGDLVGFVEDEGGSVLGAVDLEAVGVVDRGCGLGEVVGFVVAVVEGDEFVGFDLGVERDAGFAEAGGVPEVPFGGGGARGGVGDRGRRVYFGIEKP